MKNYNEILGINASASVNDIKAAYRRKVKEYHPDVSPLENASQLFIEATEAYEFLIRSKSVQTRVAPDISVHNPNEQWHHYARSQSNERARHFSRMRYEEFIKTKYYKATQTANEIYVYVSLGVSVFIIVSAIYGFMSDWYDSKSTVARYIGDSFIFLVGLIFLFFSIYQVYDLTHEKTHNR